MALVKWREHLFKKLNDRLTVGVLELIEKERNGEQIDVGLVKTIIGSYVSLGLTKDKPNETTLAIYKNHFEDKFLQETEIFYTQESSQYIILNTVADYMKKVLLLLPPHPPPEFNNSCSFSLPPSFFPYFLYLFFPSFSSRLNQD